MEYITMGLLSKLLKTKPNDLLYPFAGNRILWLISDDIPKIEAELRLFASGLAEGVKVEWDAEEEKKALHDLRWLSSNGKFREKSPDAYKEHMDFMDSIEKTIREKPQARLYRIRLIGMRRELTKDEREKIQSSISQYLSDRGSQIAFVPIEEVESKYRTLR